MFDLDILFERYHTRLTSLILEKIKNIIILNKNTIFVIEKRF